MSTVEALSRLLEVSQVSICGGTFPDEHHGLVEERYQASRFAPSRQREYYSVRQFARQAGDRLGLRLGALVKGPSGSIRWPQGVVGSVSHSKNRGVAIVGSSGSVSGLGVDVESLDRFDQVGRPLRTHDGEDALIEELASRYDIPRTKASVLLFSAKEAAFKARPSSEGLGALCGVATSPYRLHLNGIATDSENIRVVSISGDAWRNVQVLILEDHVLSWCITRELAIGS